MEYLQQQGIGGGRSRYVGPGQGSFVAKGHSPSRQPLATPAAGQRAPISHHLSLGNMIPEAMGFSPSLQDRNFHRGWDRPRLELDVRAPSHRPASVGTPPESQRSQLSMRGSRDVTPREPTGGGGSPPRAQQQSPPRSQMQSPPPTQSAPRTRAAWMDLPPNSQPGHYAANRAASPAHYGAAGARPPAGDHFKVGNMTPSVGVRDSASPTGKGGGGVSFPWQIQSRPSALWPDHGERGLQYAAQRGAPLYANNALLA